MQLKENEIEEKSKRIARGVSRFLKDQKNKCVHTFLPIKSKGEVNTLLIIEILKETGAASHIVVPRVNNQRSELEHYDFNGLEQMEYSSLGIPEPVADPKFKVSATAIDIVIVPLLAYDKSNHRVGYGKGFYDRFLAQCRSDTQKIGVSFFEHVTEIEDKNQWDVALDIVITPETFAFDFVRSS